MYLKLGDYSDHKNANKKLIIVESPTKAKKIADYLGPKYIVDYSLGHIRDLPRNASDIPNKYKSLPWARLGVNVNDKFKPLYITSPSKKSTITRLKDLLKIVDELYIATDGDREGEAIAWHLLEILDPKIPVRRMVFHEITNHAIKNAARNPRNINISLVDAQETRRILDRLYGYEISPVLWKKIAPKLSAGRVQSVATRIIVERERERMKFCSTEFWTVNAELENVNPKSNILPSKFRAKLSYIDGQHIATGNEFDSTGCLKKPKETYHLDKLSAESLSVRLLGIQLSVSSSESRPYTCRPHEPFITSTLQQEAATKLSLSVDTTMKIAQRLYENGYITYMRTDSTILSEIGINAARNQVQQLYGRAYLCPYPKQYKRNIKNTQEAHEAIRPTKISTNNIFYTPKQLHMKLNAKEFLLYELIWRRTIASQMSDAYGTVLSFRITGISKNNGSHIVFVTSGRKVIFSGFLKAYTESTNELDKTRLSNLENKLPKLIYGENINCTSLNEDHHKTSPPVRFTEASLIKKLEELGIGRPSTYNSVIKTIQDRGYTYRKYKSLVPNWIAFAVIELLEQHFSYLVDYDFTATMEYELDEIAKGKVNRIDWLSNFYFGRKNGIEGSITKTEGLKKLINGKLSSIDARKINSIKLFNDKEGFSIFVRIGRNGAYLERIIFNPKDSNELKTQRTNLSNNLTPDELTLSTVEKLFSNNQKAKILGFNPNSGYEIYVKEGRFGPYVLELSLNLENSLERAFQLKIDKKTKKFQSRTKSLLSFMDMSTVTLYDALRLLSLPKIIGINPENNKEITVNNGRYGPYLRCGNDLRSLNTEEQTFIITLSEALEIYSIPKKFKKKSNSISLIRKLGTDSISGKPIIIKNGKFGPYITDGETNVGLSKDDDIQKITDKEASELLANRRLYRSTK